MSRRIVELHPEAVEEGRQARTYYLSKSAQADEVFRRELEQAIARISERPDAWPHYLHGTRRYVLRICPYSVVYRSRGEHVLVVAIAHAKRRAGYWRTRTTPVGR